VLLDLDDKLLELNDEVHGLFMSSRATEKDGGRRRGGGGKGRKGSHAARRAFSTAVPERVVQVHI